MKNTFDELIRDGRDTDALRYLAKEYYENGKMGHTRKLLLERAAEKLEYLQKELAALAVESAKRDVELAKLEAEIVALRDVMCWVPVSERLPEDDWEPVIVYRPAFIGTHSDPIFGGDTSQVDCRVQANEIE